MTPALFLSWLFVTGGVSPLSPSAPSFSPATAAGGILVFTRTTAFRHDSIPDGLAAVRRIAEESGLPLDATEDPGAFTDGTLASYRAVVFLLTTGDVLDDAQQAAFERWATAGGGWVGVHSASDTEYDWPFYGRLVGAYFAGHPAVQPAAIRVEDRAHPATSGLPETWLRTDEWYDFRANPRSSVHVLASLDETTYSGGSMGADHPIAWCQEVSGVRSFYTAGGHTRESYSEPLFVAHLAGGIRWAAGLEPGYCGSTARAVPKLVTKVAKPTPRVINPRN
jgi:type 1 glutamine amidotransferase